MGISEVLVSVLLSTSLCCGWSLRSFDCECWVIPTEKVVTNQSFVAVVPPSTSSTLELDRQRLIAAVLDSIQAGDRPTFERFMTPESGRETVWKILSRPNRIIKTTRMVVFDDSSLTLVLDIEDDEAVKQREFDLKTVKDGDNWVISDWQYVRKRS